MTKDEIRTRLIKRTLRKSSLARGSGEELYSFLLIRSCQPWLRERGSPLRDPHTPLWIAPRICRRRKDTPKRVCYLPASKAVRFEVQRGTRPERKGPPRGIPSGSNVHPHVCYRANDGKERNIVKTLVSNTDSARIAIANQYISGYFNEKNIATALP